MQPSPWERRLSVVIAIALIVSSTATYFDWPDWLSLVPIGIATVALIPWTGLIVRRRRRGRRTADQPDEGRPL